MDASLYPRMAALEDAHWWFAARRAIVGRLLERVELPPAAAILEPGCGTGGNFPLLARRGRLFAIDRDPAAIRFAAARGLAELAEGALPDRIPFGATRFDLVVMTDVLEHLDDPGAALRALHARLTPGGSILITVPAGPWMWSDHDVTHHHRRRFRARDLDLILRGSGFATIYLSHYNFLLFPLIAGARMLPRTRSRDRTAPRHDLAMPSAPVNRLLRAVFASERFVIGSARVPFGVSLIALARAIPDRAQAAAISAAGVA